MKVGSRGGREAPRLAGQVPIGGNFSDYRSSGNSPAAVAWRGQFWQCPRRLAPAAWQRSLWRLPSGSVLPPAPINRGSFHDDVMADRSVRRARHYLRHLGHLFGARGRCRQRADAGDRGGGARGRASLSAAAVHHDRHCRRRDLPRARLFPRLAGRGRLCRRRHSVRCCGLYRHECFGARQCAHGPGGHRLAGGRARACLPRRRNHRPSGRGSRSARGDAVLHLPDRGAAFRAE